MEYYVLNKSFQTISVIENYESFLWTDRYNLPGDFELQTYPSVENLSVYQKDYYIISPESDHVMIIEGLEIQTDSESGNRLLVTGRSLESILDRRIVWNQTSINGSLQDGIKKILNENIISPSIANRKVSNFIFRNSTDTKVTSLRIEAQFTGDNILEILEEICELYSIGFKITLENEKFVFQLYAGTDRSYDQTQNTYVIFSKNFENIINSNYLENNSTLKNAALVAGEDFAEDRKTVTIGNTSGLERRELYVDARDIQSEKDSDQRIQYLVNIAIPSQTYGLTVVNAGNGEIEISGTPEASPITFEIGTFSSLPRGVYEIPYPMIVTHIENGQVVTSERSQEIATIAFKYSNGDYVEDRRYLKDKNGVIKYLEVLNTITNLKVLMTIESGGEEIYATKIKPSLTAYALQDDDYKALLTERGNEKIREFPEIKSFEGEMETTQLFKYQQDFFMGDIVQVENEFLLKGTARVIEFIRSYSTNGIEFYPTFKAL